jgi:hypothetical protein
MATFALPTHAPRGLPARPALSPERKLHDLFACWPTLAPRVRRQRLRAVVAHCPAEIAALDSLYQRLEPHATTQIRARVERLALNYLTKPALERGPLLERLRAADPRLHAVFSRAMASVACARHNWARRRDGGCA